MCRWAPLRRLSENKSLTVERGCPHPLDSVLLENGIEDEKASAGDRCPISSFQADARAHRGLLIAAIVSIAHKHQNNGQVSLFWCQSVHRGSPSTPALQIEETSDDLPVRRRMVTVSEISTESLILAQDERWRRA